MNHYHSHIYFKSKDLEPAFIVFEQAQMSGLFQFSKFHEKAIGPHPLGMIELHFNELSYAEVLGWVQSHRGDLSALIHHDTGDDLKDHTEGILWLGANLPLDFSFFELIQTRPELRVHPVNK